MVKVIVFRTKLAHLFSNILTRMSGKSQVDKTILKFESRLNFLLSSMPKVLELPVTR